MYRPLLTDYITEFVDALEAQLESDQKRWGDTWKNRPIGDYDGRGDQIDRTMERIEDYYDQ
jgi:hypothetical protein